MRNIYLIPGVRIPSLKLKPTTPDAKDANLSLDLKTESEDITENTATPTTVMAVSEMWTDVSPNPDSNPAPVAFTAPIPKAREIQKSMEDSSLASSICSTLDNIQPPSLMNSLISMSERPSLPNSPKVTSKLECRHSGLSAKKGQKVPEMVRRALELSSSFSSCQSNLDKLRQGGHPCHFSRGGENQELIHRILSLVNNLTMNKSLKMSI